MPIIYYTVKFSLFFLLHLLLFSNIAFEYCIAFVYVGFLLVLPFNLNRIIKMIIAFIIGISIDIFYDTLGIHAFSCVLIMYIRPYIEKFASSKSDELLNNEPTLNNMKFNWFFSYSIILLFVHHFLVLFLEAGFSVYFFKLLFKAVLSPLISFIIIYITERISFSLFKV